MQTAENAKGFLRITARKDDVLSQEQPFRWDFGFQVEGRTLFSEGPLELGRNAQCLTGGQERSISRSARQPGGHCSRRDQRL
jgi:hypothetical protein